MEQSMTPDTLVVHDAGTGESIMQGPVLCVGDRQEETEAERIRTRYWTIESIKPKSLSGR
jgi:hypothetical protein